MLKTLLEQFKGLNPKDPGAWPPLPKALLLLALLIGMLVGAYFIDWSDQLEQLDAGHAQEEKLKEEYKGKKQQSINLDLYRQQVREIESSFGALLRQLPNRSQMDALLVDINQAGLGRGLQFDLFKPAPQEITRDFYAELPIQLKVVGGYHDIATFASDIGGLSRIVTLNDIAITAGKGGQLVLDTTAKTFRYLDDAEINAQRRSAAQKGAKAAKK
jgi:type IV pilus assembly protein PilO